MKHVLIVGGGLSGLTSAYYLSEQNIKVTLLESSPKFGGRTYSLYNEIEHDWYDNGQHIMMGCYDETLELLKNIGTYNKLHIPESLEIPFVSSHGEIYKLTSAKRSYPLNLLIGLMNYHAIHLKSRLKIIDFFLDLICSNSEDFAGLNVKQWLENEKQPEEAIVNFWEIIVVGTMNTTLENASAKIFNEILREMFLNGNFASKFVIPDVTLLNLFVEPILRSLSVKGEVHLNERVAKIKFKENLVFSIFTNNTAYTGFDAVIVAIPPYSLKKVLFVDGEENNYDFFDKEILDRFTYAPILNIHLWLSKNPFKERFYGFLDSKIHWLFNHGKHISITTSAAERFIDIDNDKIVKEFCSELERYFPIFTTNFITSWKVIKEKRATFIPNIESQKARERIYSNYSNLFLAGDWINNGLPSTIEGAVLNGRLTAKKVFHFLSD